MPSWSNPIQAVKRLFAPSNATLANPPDWFKEALGYAASTAGVNVSVSSAMGLPTVWACVNAKSRAFSSMPLEVYRRRADGGRTVETDGPQAHLHFLLHDQPNPEMTSAFFWRVMIANFILRNNAYALIVRDGFGDVVELWPIQNKDIQPKRDTDNGPLYYEVKGKRYRLDQILHLRGLSFDAVAGVDAISGARDSIGLAIALQDYASRYFPNSVSPSAVIEFPTNLSPDQLKTFAEAFDKHNSGNANAHRRMFLWGGAKLAQKTPTNNQSAQFVENRRDQDKAICQILGVPLSKAGIMTEAHYNNIESENIAFVRDTLLPTCREIEQQLNAKMFPTPTVRARYYCEFNLEGLLRGDTQTRAAFYKTMVEVGARTSNEIRASENLNPLPGGDSRMLSQNLMLLDESGKPITPVTENASQSQPAPAK